jgi:anti-sigma B factor antagonist
MKIETQTVGRYLVARILDNRLGADGALAFKEAMTRLVEEGHTTFLLDFSEVEFIDSTGLGAILSLLKRIGRGGEIGVCGANDTVGSMFKLTRMDRVFSMYPSVSDATGDAAAACSLSIA